MIEAIAHCNRQHSTAYRLDIYGPTPPNARPYLERLERLVAERGLSALVRFCGPLPQDELPDVLAQYRLFLNFSATALDKAVLEAMACGIPVLSTNPCVREILPSGLQDLCMADEWDTVAQGERLYDLLSQDGVRATEMGMALREVVVRNHSLRRLFEKLMAEMEER